MTLEGDIHPWCKECVKRTLEKNARGKMGSRRAKERVCSQCQHTFPLSSFHLIRSSGVRHSYCRACHAAYMALRYSRLKAKAFKSTAGGRTGT